MENEIPAVKRREFLRSAATSALSGAAAFALPGWARGAANPRAFPSGAFPAEAGSPARSNAAAGDAGDIAAIRAEIEKHHDESVRRLQEWIRQPSIAAENRGMNEGCDLTMRMLRDAGFNSVTKVPTEGQPGIFATLDAGAPRTLGLYFMYAVK